MSKRTRKVCRMVGKIPRSASLSRKKIRRGSTGIIGAVAARFPQAPQGRRHWMAGNRAPAQSATAGRVAPAVQNPTTDSLHPVDDASRRERRS